MIASDCVLVEEPRTDAQMQRLVALFLSGTFLKTRALTSQPQLHNLLLVVIAGTLAANFDDPLHVTALSTDKSPCYLELLVVVDLDIKPACVLDIIIISSGSRI